MAVDPLRGSLLLGTLQRGRSGVVGGKQDGGDDCQYTSGDVDAESPVVGQRLVRRVSWAEGQEQVAEGAKDGEES